MSNEEFWALYVDALEEYYEEDQFDVEPTKMPDGTSGYLCIKCKEYYPYVEANCKDGYICRECRLIF